MTSTKYQPSAPDVLLQYGGPGDAIGNNSRARIVKVSDGAGSQSITYGPLGQPRQIVSDYLLGNRDQKLTTSFERDAWGMLHIKELDGAFTPLAGGAPLQAKIAIAYSYGPTGEIRSVRTGPDRQSPDKAAVLVGSGFDERGNNVVSVLGSGVTTLQRFDDASNRLTKLQSMIGQWCAPLGSFCPDPAPPVNFQDVAYTYDPAGNVVHYLNASRDAASGVDAVEPGKWGIMVNHSDAGFAYDELNRLVQSQTTASLAYKKPFASDQTLDGDISGAKSVVMTLTEKFAYTSLNEMGQWLRILDKTPVSPRQVTSAIYSYQNTLTHAPKGIDLQGDGDLSRTSDYDELGRLTEQHCRSCSLQTYNWNGDNTMREVKTALDVTDSTVSEEHLRAEMTYDRQSRRNSQSNYYVSKKGASSLQNSVLYADENLSVYFPKNGQPGAMWHFYAGNYRLASQWAGQTGLFTYHPTLGNQNTTDIVYGDRDHGGHTRVYQQFGYAAYGEILNSRTASGALKSQAPQSATGLANAPQWRFNGKELDRNTGLTYFGVRYFDNRTALWLSADPALPTYLEGKHFGGIFRPKNLNGYGFGWSNPLGFHDQDGLLSEPVTNPTSDEGQVVISAGLSGTLAVGMLLFGPGVTVSLGGAMELNLSTFTLAVKGQFMLGGGAGAYLGVGGTGGTSLTKPLSPNDPLGKYGYGFAGGSNTEVGGNAGFGPSYGLAVNVSDQEVGASPSPNNLARFVEKSAGIEGEGFGAHAYIGRQFSAGIAISPFRIWDRIVKTHEQLMDPYNMEPLEIRMGE
ncbi:RHS repeat-associated core domain-containing protein [Mesorhizobium sp. ArgA1]